VSAGRTPFGSRRRHERFARAVESSDPDLPERRYADELAVVGLLRGAGPALRAETSIDPAARTLLRERVLAQLSVPEPRPKPTSTPRRRSRMSGRLVIALSAAGCLVLALAGMTFLVSQNALPGQPLYGVKRTVEAAALDLTMGPEAKGFKHLELATNRVDDVNAMLAQGSRSAGDYLSALTDFNSDAAAGSTALTEFAASNAPPVLGMLRDWASTQDSRLTAALPQLPTAARSGAEQSRALADRIRDRAVDLLARTSCYTVTSGRADDIGALAASGPCDRAPSAVSAGVGTTANATPSTPNAGPGNNSAPTTGTAGPPATGTAAAQPSGPAASGQPGLGPILPPSLPSLPAKPPTTPTSVLPSPLPLPIPLPTLSGLRLPG
jgi:hypothetical protein